MNTAGDARTVRLQQQLVDKLHAAGTMVSPQVEAAFRAVPRHLFLPDVPVEEVYRDAAVTTKQGDEGALSSSSQPSIMALMLEQLNLYPGGSVLEIGAGTGYNAALLAHLVGASGHVVTADIDEDIVAAARQHLATAGVSNVQVVVGDGGLGWPGAAPYDRIIVTAGSWDIAPAWREQLRPGGRLVVPLWLRGGQQSIAFDRMADCLRSRSLHGCGFLRLRGAFVGPEAVLTVDAVPHLTVMVGDGAPVDVAQVADLLTQPPTILPVGIALQGRELPSALLWLAVHEASFAQFWQTLDGAQQQRLPALQVFPGGHQSTAGMVTTEALALLTVPPGHLGLSTQLGAETQAVALVTQEFGPAADLGDRIRAQLAAWEAAGRPGLEHLDLRAYAVSDAPLPAAGEVWLNKRWSRLRVTWTDSHERV